MVDAHLASRFQPEPARLHARRYGNVNGLHISRASISKNLAATTVAQGAGALGTASTSNLGGMLQFISRAPSDTADLVASDTYGSNDTIRAFVRAESGDLGGGLKGYISYGYLTTDKWKGYADRRQHQANAKLVKEIGDRGSITGKCSTRRPRIATADAPSLVRIVATVLTHLGGGAGGPRYCRADDPRPRSSAWRAAGRTRGEHWRNTPGPAPIAVSDGHRRSNTPSPMGSR